ncbi:MAG: Lrp/AsnC family transcriptional regulator [Theionarchaea archaeon]|nr:Lrp/AsnC family transcriptional regulator [Theionarchaea archaeon]MBU6999423.1 Lrp/AsnC family transcriptional regulator [Theionarchaea archaeon]MBU7022330.1 Lrp/AsnC family transcriptional regulator [Theionarchaea archaeon]MBU7036023.1 Lrp/AsnC family transcriptional regulator [Theionarchaea archaeon]MBU7041891.1 Lrp/AsnC family transcriptional regulator [Theionarchaea archaeon]
MIIMLDEKDETILRMLRANSRLKTKEISKKMQIPRTTVHHRIRKMIEDGIIRKFTVIPDYKKIGIPVTAFILVSFLPTTDVKQREVAQRIAELEGVYEVHLISGEWDIIIKVRSSSLERIGELVINRLREIKGVGKSVTCGCFFTTKEEP